MSLGRGSVIIMSKNQKINTQSLVEADIIGAKDALPGALWTCYFTEEQGFTVKNNNYVPGQHERYFVREERTHVKHTEKEKYPADIFYVLCDRSEELSQSS